MTPEQIEELGPELGVRGLAGAAFLPSRASRAASQVR
jgi:hypothetical protein